MSGATGWLRNGLGQLGDRHLGRGLGSGEESEVRLAVTVLEKDRLSAVDFRLEDTDRHLVLLAEFLHRLVQFHDVVVRPLAIGIGLDSQLSLGVGVDRNGLLVNHCHDRLLRKRICKGLGGPNPVSPRPAGASSAARFPMKRGKLDRKCVKNKGKPLVNNLRKVRKKVDFEFK